MKIWIDGYEANVEQRLGSSQVAYELLRYIEKLDRINDYTIFLPTPPLGDMPKERAGFRYQIIKPKFLWTKIALPFALFKAKDKADLFFSPTHYIPHFSSCKKIAMIFDLAYLYFPQAYLKKDLWKLKNWTKYSIQKANHLITISHFSKKEIINHYQVDPKKITVAYPGFNKDLYYPIQDKDQIKKILVKYGIDEDYLLYIGTIQPKKNLIKLIDSFAIVLQDLPKLKLVIVGKTKGLGRSGWKFEEILQRPKELGIDNKVIFTGFAPTEDLPLLINGAIAYILPSLWEGFGIPVVDSMACGTPVIVSNVSSLPEVAGKAGLLIDPQSGEQIAQAIRTIAADKKLRLKLSKEGIIQAQKFSWEKMAKIVLKVFQEAG